MADLYYYETGYIDESYFVYTADAAAAPSSNFTISCDATVIGATIEADAALTSTATVSATATVGKETSVSLTSSITATATATRIQEASAAFTSAFAPSLSVEVFKNSFAVLDCPSVLTATVEVNRSITQALDTIASLNAMAARTRDLASSLDSTSTLTTSPTALKSSSANSTSTLTLSADALNLQLASASLASAFSVGTTKYVGVGRPRNITYNPNGVTFSSSIKKFGSHSLTHNTTNGIRTTTSSDRGLIPAPNKDWAFEGWFYPLTTTSANRDIFLISGEQYDSYAFLAVYITNSLLTVGVKNLAGTVIFSGSSTIGINSWYHILIVKNSSAWSFYINGTRIATSTSNLTATYGYSNTGLSVGDNWTSSQPYYDDVSFHIGTTLGFDPTASSITVPTAARLNDPDTTRVLLHFNNDLLDDISYTAQATAALTSTATLSASGTKTTGTSSAALTSTATLVATATRVQEGSSNLDTAFTATGTATRIPSTAQAAFESTSSLTASLSITREAIGDLSSLATQNLDYTRTRQAESNLSSAFAPTLSVEAQRAGVALLESVTTLSVEAAKTTGVSSDLNSTTTVTVNAGLLIAISSSLTSASTLAIDYLHLVGVSAAINSEFSTSTAASRTRAIASAITATSALTADASRTRNISSDLNTTATQTATGIRIQPGNSALVSTATLDANAVKTATATSAVASVVTQSTLISLTVDPQIATSAIATELVVAFKNATGTITMESSFAQTAIVGKIIQYQPNQNLGVRSGGDPNSIPRLGPLSGLPFGGLKWSEPGLVVSIWARRKTTNTFNVLWTYDYEPSSPQAIGALVIDNNNVRLRNYFDADEPGATWANLAPVDTEWHNYVLQCSRQYGYWKLWIDGVYQGERLHQATFSADWGNSGYIRFGSGLNRSAGLQYDETETTDGNLDFAQIWVGLFPTDYIQDPGGNYYRASPLFNSTEFYNGGYVDLGDNGRGAFNQLPTPYIYNRLSGAYTYQYAQTTYSVVAAEEALRTPDLEARALLTAAPSTVIVNIVSLAAVSTMTTAIDSRTRSPILGLESQLILSANFIRIRSAQAELISTSTQTTQTDRVTDYQVDMTATATLTCAASELQGISLGVDAQATLTVVNTRTRSFDGAIESQATVTASPDSRTRTPILEFAATSTLTCEALTFEGVACPMTAITSLTVDTQVVKVTPVALTVMATLGAEGFKLVLAQANLTVTGFQLTQGDIINFLPELEIRVPQETRYRRVLPETRVYSIDSESRTRRVLPESRIITQEQETDVNII